MFSRLHTVKSPQKPRSKVWAKAAIAKPEAVTARQSDGIDIWSQPAMPSISFPTSNARSLQPQYFNDAEVKAENSNVKPAEIKITGKITNVIHSEKAFTPPRDNGLTLSKNYYPERFAG